MRTPVTGTNSQNADTHMKGNSAGIVISDLDALAEKGCISEEDPNLWRAIPYQTEEFSGVMLGCGEGANPRPITVKLGVRGRHRIWLGLYSFIDLSRIRARLSSDLCCQMICPPKQKERISYPVISEVFWKEADLAGQDLILEGAYKPDLHPGALAYIRLEPIEKIRAAEKMKVAYPLATTNDGHGIFGEFSHSRPEDLLESFERIPDESCMRLLLWGCGEGDICNYPTTVGTYQSLVSGTCLSPFYNTMYHNRRLWKQKGWDSLRLVRDYAKNRGWEFQVYLRIEGFYAQYPFDRIRSKFFLDHPEYHCFDREGRRVGRLSYAYPEVREHILSLISEIARYGPDGVCLAFIRGVPLVLYEPIMVEAFQKKFGVDPRALSEFDARWMEYQAEVITPFLRMVKAVLEPHQRLSAMVPGDESDCRRWGLDVASWVREGLVDDLFPVGQRFTEEDVHVDGPEHLDFRFFDQLGGRERIRLIPMLYPWNKFQEDYRGWRQLLFSFLDQGADGYGVWDGTDRFSLIGDIGYEARTSEPVPPKTEFRTQKLLMMNGYRFDRYHHFEVI